MDQRGGVWNGAAAYLIWGLFPLYFVLFARSSAIEVVAYRALWSLLFCLLLLWVTGTWSQLGEILAERKSVLVLSLAGVLIAANWTIYVYGVSSGRTLDAALGYFINPLAVAGLGVIVLGERLRPGQWLALACGLASVVVLVIGYGEIPFIALGLALTFGLYSLVKKLAGRSVAPAPGLAVETGAVAPVAFAVLAFLGWTGQASVSPISWYAVLMASTGVVTAIPLLLFAAAARKVRMITLAMLQYLAPIGQFLIGWLVFKEPLPLTRWLGFGLIWLALIVFAVDAVLMTRRGSGAQN